MREIPQPGRRCRLRLTVPLITVALLFSACAADRPRAAPSTTVDCVAAGTCPEGLEGTQTGDTKEPTASGDMYLGFPVGFTEDGYPYLGDPDAPVSLVEFSDYLCPFCGRHFNQTTPQLLEQYVLDGRVNLVFRDFPLVELHPNAPAGHAAALCVAEQSAALFWAYHDELFADQIAWANLPGTDGYLTNLARAVGADLDDYRTCIDSGRTVPIVEERVAQGRRLGFSGTPSFHIVDNDTGDTSELVGAQPLETFAAALDAAIAGETPAADPPDSPQNLPYWASEEGLVPDPARPGYTLAGDAYRGNPGAEVVVVEISDFQCPFCLRHTVETQPDLDRRYVDTDKVRWVFKHFPLQIHAQAPAAAAAAECAGDQGAFWEMHDLLFERVDEWAVDPPDPVLIDLAGDLGLDETAFTSCVGSRAALERVVADLYDVTGIFSSTPSFVILHEGQASVISGAQPLEQFVTALDGLLGE